LWALCCSFFSIKIYVCTWVDLLFVNIKFILRCHVAYLHWTMCHNIRLWGDFLSLYSRFYEVTILESTYTINEKNKCKCIFRCWITFIVKTKWLASYASCIVIINRYISQGQPFRILEFCVRFYSFKLNFKDSTPCST
jgi:hypothetical protein